MIMVILADNNVFERNFYSAYQLYLSGNWQKCIKILVNDCLRLKPKDGPSQTLKKFILSKGANAPHHWKGYRCLT